MDIIAPNYGHVVSQAQDTECEDQLPADKAGKHKRDGLQILSDFRRFLKRQNAVLLLICNNIGDQIGRNRLLAVGEAVDQGSVA